MSYFYIFPNAFKTGWYQGVCKCSRIRRYDREGQVVQHSASSAVVPVAVFLCMYVCVFMYVCVCMYVCWYVLARYHFQISVSLPTFSDDICCDFFSLTEFRDISFPIGHNSLYHSHHPLHSMMLNSVDDTHTHPHTRWNPRRRSQECDSLLKRNNKYCTTYLLKRFVFEMQVAVKGCNLSDHQTKGTSAPRYTYSVWRGRSERSDIDPVNCQEVLRCPSVGLFAILVWYS